MAGMFYTLQQAAEKLNMTEQQVEQLVTQGKLREFRDGANVHFKIVEVEALMTETPAPAPPQEAPPTPAQEVPPTTSQEAPPAPPEQGLDDTDIALFDEGAEESKPEAKLDDFSLDSGSGSEISLGSEFGDGDTAAGEEGVNILGETGSDVISADDSLSATDSGTGEASLQEIEDDVNLDTFGSGSGLLDLSLQADDTSLGGILDEIYTSEGEQETGESSALDFGGGGGEPALPDDEALAEAEPEIPMVPMVPMAMEVAPDTMSNAMGIVLVLPLIAVIYTAIVSVAGQQGVMPSVLDKIQSMGSPYGIHIIWYIMGGIAVVSGLIMAGAAMLGGGATAGTKKPKAKKAKAPKPKKEKKPKKSKKSKKPKKPKKAK